MSGTIGAGEQPELGGDCAAQPLDRGAEGVRVEPGLDRERDGAGVVDEVVELVDGREGLHAGAA